MSSRTRKCYAARVKSMPPALSLDQLKQFEAGLASDADDAVVRTTALYALVAPASVVFDAIAADREHAVLFAALARQSRDHAAFLARIQQALRESANRIEIALEQRSDAGDVVREAEAAIAREVTT